MYLIKKINSHLSPQPNYMYLYLIFSVLDSLYEGPRLHRVGIQAIFDEWINALVMEMIGECVTRKIADFPGSPVFKMLCSNAGSISSIPGWGK